MNKASPIEVLLKPEWFAHIPELLGIRSSELFPVFAQPQITIETAKKEMKQAGLLDQNGAVNHRYAAPLQTLTQASSSSRLRFLCEGDLLEYQVFWSTGNNSSVSISREAGGFALAFPHEPEKLISIIAEYTGVGTFTTIPAVGTFTHVDALALAACHDLIRQTMYLAMGSAHEWQTPQLMAGQILQHINQPNLSSESLVWSIQSVLQNPLQPELKQIQMALQALVKSGYLTPASSIDSFLPEESLLFLCRRMMLFNSLLKLEAMRISGGSLAAAIFTSIQCGLRDILMIEESREGIIFSGVSARQLLLLLGEYLTNPAAVKMNEPGTANCACGKAFADDARFCKFCGQPRPEATDEKPCFCSKCGSPLKPGKPFCTKCGNKAI